MSSSQQFLIESRELVDQASDDLLALEKAAARRRTFRRRVSRVPYAEGRRRHRRVRRDARGAPCCGECFHGRARGIAAALDARHRQLPHVSRPGARLARYYREHGRRSRRTPTRPQSSRASRGAKPNPASAAPAGCGTAMAGSMRWSARMPPRPRRRRPRFATALRPTASSCNRIRSRESPPCRACSQSTSGRALHGRRSTRSTRFRAISRSQR